LTIGAVTGLAVLADKGRSRVVFTVVALMLTVLPSTWSRAAFITVGLLMLWLFRAKQCRYRFLVWGIFVVIAAAVYFAKKGSADGRLVIWTATILSWRHCPLTGVGTGGFAHGCSEGIAEMYNSQILPSFLDSAGVADNAFNVFLKILIEQGLVGLILFAMILVVFIKGLYSSSRPLFYGMLGLIIFSMFSYPLEQLPYRIIAVMIAAWSESNRKQTISFWGTKIITVLAFILTIMAGMFIREEAYNRFRADKDAKMLSCQKSEDLIDDFFELLPLEEDNPQFLYDFAMTLSENGRFNDSNTILSKGCMISADPMFYVLKGNNYYSMNQPYQAEKTYVKAFSVLPNRIYPLYKLMLLYSETGQDYKALMMAKAIIDIKPKVESPATEEMKEKAHRVLSE
jgi:tetratricopeptide (TPR) repeat protein